MKKRLVKEPQRASGNASHGRQFDWTIYDPRKRWSYRRHVRFHSRIGRNDKSRLSRGQLEVSAYESTSRCNNGTTS